MAGRNRGPRQHEIRGYRDIPHHAPPSRGLVRPMPPHPLPMEEELALRRNDIRRMAGENQILMDEIFSLRREIPIVKDELHHLSLAIPKLRAEKEMESRELIQRGLKLEAELRSLEPIKPEAMQLRAEARKAEASREEMSAKVKGLSDDLKHLQSENQKMPVLRSELDNLHEDLVHARSVYDYEKKAGLELMEQVQVMEKNLISMAREAEQLRAELEKRARGPGIGAYGPPNTDMGYPGLYGSGYDSDKGRYGGALWPSYGSGSHH